MIVTLIRHSLTTPDSSIPIPLWGLNEKGVELAKELSQNPIIQNLECIYTSLEIKALETGVIIAKNKSIPMRTDSRLCEITSFTNKMFPDFESYAQDFFEDRVERWNNGESKSEALERFNKAIEDIKETNYHNVGIVSHGSILTLFLSQYISKPLWDIHTSIKMPDIRILDVENNIILENNLR